MLERADPALPGSATLVHTFAGLADAPALLLAVSGGPDSMALLDLATRWRAGLDSGPALHVATVDHGLRSGSASEAAMVAAACATRGLPHATLVWEGVKPRTAIQAKARAARYALLVRHAEAVGAPFLLTAHHADDQAETVLMRLGRGSGPSGLAAMRRATPLGDAATLVRPLLGWTKADLLAICRAAGLAVAHDPSNDDLAFLRVRLRRQAESAAALGLDRLALLRLARRMARADEALEQETARVTALLAAETIADRLRFDLAPLRDAAPEIFQRVLARLIPARGGRTPPLARLEAAADAIHAALAARRLHRGTLGGVVLALDAAGWLTVAREPSRRRGRGPD